MNTGHLNTGQVKVCYSDPHCTYFVESVYLCFNSKCFLIFVLVQNHASEERRAFQSQSLVQPQENQQSSGKQFYSIFANQICSLYLRSSLLIM